jgi:uncharacterized membrane protein YjgN (DUF898 family)/tetratricopeptide (TPR) repeat protein
MMAKGNCNFTGTGGQYFVAVLLHLFIFSSLTFGLYSPWAWVRIFRLKASHTVMNGKRVTFGGTGAQLFRIIILNMILMLITLGLYTPWAMCRYFRWRAVNTHVDGRPSTFTGTGGALFFFLLLHFLILPILTLGLYYFIAPCRLYAWREEHTRYGRERTSFGASCGKLFLIMVVGGIVNIITFSLFTPWAYSMLFRWQVHGTAVGDGEGIKHFPPSRTNLAVVAILILLALSPFVILGPEIIKGIESNLGGKITIEGIINFFKKTYEEKGKAIKLPVQKPGSFAVERKGELIPETGEVVTMEASAMEPSGVTPVDMKAPRSETSKKLPGKEISAAVLTAEKKKPEAKSTEKTSIKAPTKETVASLTTSEKKPEPKPKPKPAEMTATKEAPIQKDAEIPKASPEKKTDQTPEEKPAEKKAEPKKDTASASQVKVQEKKAAEYDAEIKDLNALIERDIKKAEVFYNRALVYAAKGNFTQAEKDYTEAIRLNQKFSEAYFNRGLLYVEMNKKDLALKDFSDVIKLNPKAFDAYCNRGNVNFELGKKDLAIQDYSKALEIRPNDKDLFYNRAVVYLSNGDQSKGLEDMKKAALLKHEKAREYLEMPSAQPVPESSAPEGSKTAVEPTSVEKSDMGWRMELENVRIPNKIAGGKIRGHDFIVEDAKLENGILTLRQGKDFFMDYGVVIFLFLKQGEEIEQRVFNVSRDQQSGSPHIHMKWKPKDKDIPKTQTFIKDYAMRLQFFETEEGKLSGKIYLSLPDEMKSFIVGRFTAAMEVPVEE